MAMEDAIACFSASICVKVVPVPTFDGIVSSVALPRLSLATPIQESQRVPFGFIDLWLQVLGLWPNDHCD